MKEIRDVETYWNTNPCQIACYLENSDKKQAFLEIEKERYSVFADILKYADFSGFKGKKVLEVGCGIATDGIQFVQNGADYTGVDLTDAAISIAKERFGLFNQKGEFFKINAEKLPFPDNYFDHIYSFGVIHHSPHPELIVDEIYRVLKAGGTINVMLYNRTSFYYLIEVKLIRKIFFNLSDKKRFWNSIFKLFGKRNAARFESLRQKFEKMKIRNSKPSNLEWISMNTDGAFCPIARVYSKSESRKLFGKFKEFNSKIWFIDKNNWFLWIVFGRLMPKGAEKWLESHSGWFRMIKAKK